MIHLNIVTRYLCTGLLFMLAVAFAGDAPANDGLLSRVQLQVVDAGAMTQELEDLGFDVLHSMEPTSLEVIVSFDEWHRLVDMGLDPLLLERGRPYKEVQAERLALGGGTPPDYPDLASLIQSMTDFASANPTICEFVDLTDRFGAPVTFEGRHIFGVKISDNVTQNEDEPVTLLVSAHHVREIVTPVIALYAMEQLTSLYGTDPQITSAVDNNEIWIIPTMNPDGYNHVFEVDFNWRKNRRVFPSGIGVDLNRNYPFGWDHPCSGSSTVSSQTYKGPTAASEPETQTLIALSRARRVSKVIDYHSSGREVLWSYNCVTHPFDAFQQSEAIELANQVGYFGSNRRPSADGEHYQWQVAELSAFAFLIETQLSFQPSYSSAQAEAVQVWPGTLWMLEYPVAVSGQVTEISRGATPVEASIRNLTAPFSNGETISSGGDFGRYQLFLPAGTYDLEFTLPGYDPQVHQVTVTAGEARTLDVQFGMAAPPCPGDFNGSDAVDVLDMVTLVRAFGQIEAPEDLNGDGTVDIDDLLLLISTGWGPCE